MSRYETETRRTGNEVAVVGLAGRFPGARNVREFWRDLEAGVESISFFSCDELAAEGIPAEVLDRPNYVRAKGSIEDFDLFDAEFFGYSPREAEIIDPQQRLLLETSWEALENAGYDPERYDGKIGIWAGCTVSHYLLQLYPVRERLSALGVDPMMLLIGNDKDALATRVAHRLDLKGAAISVQTACSSSLVAVHQACQSLLLGESDLGLAGGVSVTLPQKEGHFFTEESILSPDGHCRAFDARAQGTVFGCGAGLVVLKRLEDALADGDTIWAVVRGSAVNNDGADKVGFTAPSVDGQASVIVEALAAAGVEADSIGYLEAHGTATSLGDSIEIAALTKAYRTETDAVGACALGSVKTNIGHLEAAAGIAGFVKAVLALRHGKIPPSLHFTSPHPEIGLEKSPFYVAERAQPWPRTPRRAGVSSFGFGGTNVHVILEETPAPATTGEAWPWQLLPISARTPSALEAAAARLREALAADDEKSALADVAFTLQTGRRAFEVRAAAVCRDRAEALEILTEPAERLISGVDEGRAWKVLFLFPGQGAQHVDMARELYAHIPTFRAEVDTLAERFRSRLDIDPRDVLAGGATGDELAETMRDTGLAQPTLFVLEVALARLWISLGAAPAAMLGHSLGEYAAAHLAGVLTLDDAVALVSARARLVRDLPRGEMVTVFLPVAETEALLGDELAVAAELGPRLTTVAGPAGPMAALRSRLMEDEVEFRDLFTSHAFHSSMMDPILDAFAREVASVTLHAPQIPYVSSLTGRYITDAEATDPGYWVRHLRDTSRFGPALAAMLQDPERVVLEVGPGHALTSLARQHSGDGGERVFLPSLPHPRDPHSQVAHVLETAAEMWTLGLDLDWRALHEDGARLRVPLPTYPFERRRYFLDARELGGAPAAVSASAPSAKSATPSRTPDEPRAADTSPAEQSAPAPADKGFVGGRHAGGVRTVAYAAPSTEVEEVLCDMWSTLLGVERVGVNDNFFRLGGNSLVALQAITRIRELTGVKLSVRTFFESPTVAEMASEVDAQALPDDEVAAQLEILDEIRRLGDAAAEGGLGASPPGEARAAEASPERSAALPQCTSAPETPPPTEETFDMKFSIFFFSGDEASFPDDKYQLVIESAKFADRHGFHAVWTPERHFHGFGGLYPNPAVLGAALAMVTERLQIRAGSVVLPLHHPVEIAEQWSVVDHLSGGRVGLAFASGFHPSDFLFAPGNFAERRINMFEKIDHLRRFWRGETFRGPDGAGTEIEVTLFPRPCQPELPVWITCANTPTTFEKAGEIGANVLTSLIGLSVDGLKERIGRYREARRRAGHDPEGGEVTLMIHTFLGEDLETVRATVRGPFCDYLRSHTQLLRSMAKSLHQYEDGEVNPADLEELLIMEFERYFAAGSLMGTPSSVMETLDSLRGVGVTEVGCLLDFGVDVESVLASLRYIEELRQTGVPAF